MKKRKKLWMGVSIGVLTAGMAMGTFAWQSLNQMAKNEKVSIANPGARLHDDFDGEKKAVYVENFTTPEEGTAVYVRVRLDEYMEYGDDAGGNLNGNPRDVTVLETNTDINDVTTWRTHKPDTDGDTDPFHEYWSFSMGGSTIYMPTFNKNKDSLTADINGTYAGRDKDPDTGTPYDDYQPYTLGQTKETEAYYDADADSDDEGKGIKPGNGGTLNDDYTEAVEKHTAAQTASATLISMDAWIQNGCQAGNYWVWDTDGWYYWALPLNPGKTTGCLLSGIQQTKYGEKIYYGINVVGQFATAGDWGDKAAGTGFYANGSDISDNAKKLLDTIQQVVTGDDGELYLNCGSNTYRRILDTGGMSSLICAGVDMKIGTSDDKTNVIDVSAVYSEGFTFNGTNYGTLFLKADGGSTIYYSVGTDKNLGTYDDDKLWYIGTQPFPEETNKISDVGADKVTVLASGNPTTIWANKTLNFTADVTLNGTSINNKAVTWNVSGGSTGTTIDAQGKLSVAEDEKAGTILEITAVSQEDARAVGTYTVTVEGPDTIQISGDTESKPGNTLNYQAVVTKGGKTYSTQKVQWSVSGGKTSTSIDSDTGALTIGADETHGTTLTVTAASVNNPAVTAKITIDIYVAKEGDVLTLDSTDFYVMKISDNKALLLTTTCDVNKYSLGVNGIWRDCSIRTYLNKTTSGGWLYGKPTIQNCVVATDIYTQSASGTIQTTDKVFLLSEEDVYGTSLGKTTSIFTKGYTAGGKLNVSNAGGTWIAIYPGTTTKTAYWLRSYMTGGKSTYVGIEGKFASQIFTIDGPMTLVESADGYGVRPVLWIDLTKLN